MSLTKTREPKTKNLGELLGRFIEIEHRYDNLSEEMAAFGAPSECGTLAWRGRDRELEQLQDQIEK